MKKSIILGLCLLGLISLGAYVETGFRLEQKKNARVKTAYDEKYTSLKADLSKAGFDIGKITVCFRAFKKEGRFEVWVREGTKGGYTLFRSYEICAASGDLGPKRKGGDGQVPEGFYQIDRFNPYSNFYLSLGVSYPNKSDRILGYKANLGGDIFIHGSCVTIGCIPLTDPIIKEVYLLAVESRNNSLQNIPVMIFPCEMNAENMSKLKTKYNDSPALVSFWENIETGYSYFEKNKKVPVYTVDKNGKYVFESN